MSTPEKVVKLHVEEQAKKFDTYTEDLSFDLTDPNAIALFVPSLGPNYVGYTSTYQTKMEKTEYRKPSKYLHPDGRELNFMREDSASFYWPYVLYSAGHADLKITREDIDVRESLLRKRNKSKTIVIGDSGGYQVGKGVLEFDWKNFECEKNNVLRLKILRWLEATADYSMTLDCPAWGIGDPNCGLKSFEECLVKTKYNNDFFIKNRVPGATKFLNVLQGRNQEECDLWWDTVKDYEFEGWAAANPYTADFELSLNRLIAMRDGGYLNKNQNWLHILGVSRMSGACAFTAIQRAIRKYVEPTFTISYDASSPLFSASKGRMYTKNTYSSRGFSYTMDQVIDDKNLVGSELGFPLLSPIGRKLTLGDLCVKSKEMDSKSSWDSFSYMYIMQHNIYMHVRGIKEVNRFYDLPYPVVQNYIPKELLEFRDLIHDIFKSEKPHDLIASHTKLLKNLNGLKMDNRKLDAFQTSGFFELEAEDANVIDDNIEEHEFDDRVIGE